MTQANTQAQDLEAMMNGADEQQPDNSQSNSKAVQKAAIMDMVKSMELAKSERDHQTAVAKSLKDNHGIPVKVSKRAAKIVFNASKVEEQATQEAVDALLDVVLR